MLLHTKLHSTTGEFPDTICLRGNASQEKFGGGLASFGMDSVTERVEMAVTHGWTRRRIEREEVNFLSLDGVPLVE